MALSASTYWNNNEASGKSRGGRGIQLMGQPEPVINRFSGVASSNNMTALNSHSELSSVPILESVDLTTAESGSLTLEALSSLSTQSRVVAYNACKCCCRHLYSLAEV